MRLVPAALLLAAPLGAQGAPAYHALQLDCARYRQAIHTTIQLESRGERTLEVTDRDGVLVLRATARDSLIGLEAWFDTLFLAREGSGERLVPATDGLIGGRFTGLLTRRGGFTATDRPFIPDEVAQVADVGDALEELLPPLPTTELAPGAGSRDAFGTVILRLPDGTRDGRRVARYRLTRTLEREEERILPDSSRVRAVRQERETGSYEWSPEAGTVRWERTITIDVEVPVGGPVKRPFRTRIEQLVTIERVGSLASCR